MSGWFFSRFEDAHVLEGLRTPVEAPRRWKAANAVHGDDGVV